MPHRKVEEVDEVDVKTEIPSLIRRDKQMKFITVRIFIYNDLFTDVYRQEMLSDM